MSAHRLFNPRFIALAIILVYPQKAPTGDRPATGVLKIFSGKVEQFYQAFLQAKQTSHLRFFRSPTGRSAVWLRCIRNRRVRWWASTKAFIEIMLTSSLALD